MATRVLPGVYVNLNDMSQIPEGATALKVGYVVDAKRGPVNEWRLVTSPTDFLARYTLSGAPSLTDDPTFYSILKVLSRTNSMYIVRAAKNPLYGGVVVKKTKDYGRIIEIDQKEETITLEGDEIPQVDEVVMITGTEMVDGYFIVKEVSGKVIKVTGNLVFPGDNILRPRETAKLLRCPVVPLSTQKIANIVSAISTDKAFIIEGDVSSKFTVGQTITVKNSLEVGYTNNDGTFTVVSANFDFQNTETILKVKEAVEDGIGGEIYQDSLTTPEGYSFDKDDLMLLTGIDAGAYNGKLAFTITSSVDNQEDLVYYPGADVGGEEPCTFGTMKLEIVNTETNKPLEEFIFSRDPNAKGIDGSSLFVDNILSRSAYIKCVNNKRNTDLPNSTIPSTPVQASGGSNGDPVDEETLTAALEVFKDKTIPISLLGNGCSTAAETKVFQDAMIKLAGIRKDILAFVNTRKLDEQKTYPSDRAQGIVDYKKGELASTSFYGCMYGPHVKTSDIFNQRQVEIGADAVAIAGWLDIINTLNYPYAYAGPRNGLVSGVTCDWKIGDESSEAESLNDASVNYIAYDGKVGRYYMQCQNTLQIANSVMRNIGAVLNILDIKEHLATALKEYLQLPITLTLRQDILNTCNDYLSPMVGVRFYNYLFQDVSTDFDIADNTLRYLLTIAPTAYANRIYVTCNIVNANFDWSILQSA